MAQKQKSRMYHQKQDWIFRLESEYIKGIPWECDKNEAQSIALETFLPLSKHQVARDPQ